jgi:hypothetical protein
MSIFDAELMLRDSTAGALDADEATPASVDFGGPDQHALTYVVVCPVAEGGGTTPSLDIVIQESDNDSTWRDAVVFPQIPGADPPDKYYMTAKLGARYRRYTATLGNADNDFGTVLIAAVIGGTYEDF